MTFTVGENADLNQYWYSKATIEALVSEVEAQCKVGAAFLSTPSLYFSLKDEGVRGLSKVFEYDKQWAQDDGFVFYDYNKPEEVSVALFGQFDVVVIDPPFITKECWEQYAKTARLLLCPGGKLICTTIVENEGLMHDLLGCHPCKFQPSIPNLVYQYNTYVSYSPTHALDKVNPEIAVEQANPAKQIQRDLIESREQFISQAHSRPGRDTEKAIPVERVAKNQWDRVPEGLTEYPDGQAAPAEAAAPQSYGAEYDAVLKERALVGEVSKVIDGICKPLERMAKLSAVVTKEGQPREKVEAAELDLAATKETHAAMVGSLRAFQSTFPESDESVGRIIADAIALLDVDTITTAQFKTIAPDVQMKFKSPLFNRQKTLLAKLKQLKKACQ